MTDYTRAEVEGMLAALDAMKTDLPGELRRKLVAQKLQDAAPDLARQLLAALDRVEALEGELAHYAAWMMACPPLSDTARAALGGSHE